MGALTHSKLDRAVIARYFTFLVVSQLVIFTLIGVIFSKFRLLYTWVSSFIDFFLFHRFGRGNCPAGWSKGELFGYCEQPSQ
jgi:hypothetical protein